MSQVDDSSPDSDIDRKKTKRRNIGSYPCPDCGKVFSRTDHLSRHYLNHQPKQVYQCDFVLETIGGGRRKCGKTFVRRDLRDRHIKRHFSSSPNARVNWSSVPPTESPGSKVYDSSSMAETPMEKSPKPVPMLGVESPLQISNLIHAAESSGPVKQDGINQEINVYSNNTLQSQTDILSWLFTDSSPMNGTMFPVQSPQTVYDQQIGSFPADFRYDLAGTNIFQNDTNPLDEILRSSSANKPNQLYRTTLKNGFENPLVPQQDDATSSFGFNGSSASMTSPTSTNESNTTPKSAIDPTHSSHKSLQEYGVTHNIPTNKNLHINESILEKLFIALPSLKKTQVEQYFYDKVKVEDRFSYYLSIYWLVFHPQFNFLHRGSFNTETCEPLLLFAMILIGCNYCTSADNPPTLSSPRSKSPEYKLAINIAKPLRYEIFQNEGFKSPVKLWILQSLNLLEWSEKNFLSRAMHERAHIHHASTVQLMRRSPVLGGNPGVSLKNTSLNVSSSGQNGSTSDGEDEDSNNDNTSNDTDLFNKWVESESMKRTTFMTFYLDISDYVKFRHNAVILFHQLQLIKLPCADELWEAVDVKESFHRILKKQKRLHRLDNDIANQSFLSILKRLLKNGQISKSTRVSPFVKKILYGGLISIMDQMQQLEVQNTLSLITLPNSGNNLQIWKQMLTVSIDNYSRVVGENCCSINLNKQSNKIIDDSVSKCKFPIYHITQMVGMPDLNTYDISIYCGSPANQNVDISLKDRAAVEKKLLGLWVKKHNFNSVNDIVNIKGIVHCYIYLWETITSDVWAPDKDYFDALFGISLAMQALWSYCFLTSGSESSRYYEISDNIQELTYDKLVDLSAETAYDYLFRIKQEFSMNLRKNNLHNSHSIENMYNLESSVSPDEILVKFCEILPNITNKQNISGLCFLTGSRLYNSQWELVRENGRLLINCGLRSIGKKEVFCPDVFEVELLD